MTITHVIPREVAESMQTLFTVPSEQQLMEQPDYNLLFRWFVGLGMETPVWDRTVYSINRNRLRCMQEKPCRG